MKRKLIFISFWLFVSKIIRLTKNGIVNDDDDNHDEDYEVGELR